MTRYPLPLCVGCALALGATSAGAQWQMPPAPSAAPPAGPPATAPPYATTPVPAPAPATTTPPPHQGQPRPWPPAPAYPPPPAPAYPRPAGPPPPPPPDAPPDDEPSGAFDLAAGTQFPLLLGPQLTIELPGRVLLQGEVGWMPAGYGKAVVGLIEAFGKKNAVLGPVIEQALADSFVARVSAGWRPIPGYGLEIVAGYTHISVSGMASPEVVASMLEGDLDNQVEAKLTQDMPVEATLHNFHVALGWRWLAAEDHLVIRASIGYTQTVGSSSSVQVPENPEIGAQIAKPFSDGVDTVLTNDVKLPVLGLMMGYRF